MISGRSPPVSVRHRPALAPHDSNARLLRLQSRKFGMESEIEYPDGEMTSGATRSPGSLTGRGSTSTAFATLKIAVVAAMPSAIVSVATSANPGRLRRVRIEKRKSLSSDSMGTSHTVRFAMAAAEHCGVRPDTGPAFMDGREEVGVAMAASPADESRDGMTTATTAGDA